MRTLVPCLRLKPRFQKQQMGSTMRTSQVRVVQPRAKRGAERVGSKAAKVREVARARRLARDHCRSYHDCSCMLSACTNSS
jgi:hypothetical protein